MPKVSAVYLPWPARMVSSRPSADDLSVLSGPALGREPSEVWLRQACSAAPTPVDQPWGYRTDIVVGVDPRQSA